MTNSTKELQEKRDLNNLRTFVENLYDSELDYVVGECLTRRKKLGRSLTPISWKICDKCALTFPYNTLVCDRCTNPKLRIIEKRHNYDQILDAMKI